MHAIHQIGKRFWYATPISLTDRPVLGMVVGENKTLMIDAGNSEDHAKYFLNEMKKRDIPSPDLVVLTHWHWDHIFGLSALTDTVSIASIETKREMEKLLPFSWSDDAIDERVNEGVEIEFCAKAIKEEFKNHRDIQITLPDLTFDKRVEIHLGGVTCVVQQVGGDHAADSVIVYIKEEKILFLADCMYAKMYAPKVHYTVQETRRLVDRLESFEAEIYLLSHQSPITKKAFEEEVKLLRTIANVTELCEGDEQKIVKEYENHVKRELSEDEIECITYFVNGY